MNITRQSTGTLTERITLQVTKEDYAEKVEKTLKEYKRKANIPGFRPGRVPMQLIERMYGKAVLLDELEKLVGENLDQYINAQQLKILGDPIMATDSPSLDLEKADSFEFAFEVGLQPEITIEWPKKDKLQQYEIVVTDEIVDEEIKNYTRRFGERLELDKVNESCSIISDIAQIDENGQVVENGLMVKDFAIDLSVIDDDKKAILLGAEKGSMLNINLKSLFHDEKELLYKLKQEDKSITDIPDSFQLTVKSIFDYKNHEINQELYDKIFGEGVITSDEMFREKMREEIAFIYWRDVLSVNIKELKKYLISTQQITLPTEFLKKWFVRNQKDRSEEEVDKNFPILEEEFKWQLIKNKIITDHQIKLNDEDVLAYASEIMRWQMRSYYGIIGMPAEKLKEYGKMLLQKEEDVRQMVSDLLDNRALEVVKEHVKVENKKVTPEEFYEISHS